MLGLLIAIIYLSFISLGLPDSLLGSAWPVMRIEFDAPLSFAGIISVIICAGTIISSLLSDRLTKKFGTALVTATSVTMTAVALFLFSISTEFWMLIIFAIPYGLGAGGVDASLNNYVALHLKARHMSWLHCMWGVGAAISYELRSNKRHGLESGLSDNCDNTNFPFGSAVYQPAAMEKVRKSAANAIFRRNRNPTTSKN